MPVRACPRLWSLARTHASLLGCSAAQRDVSVDAAVPARGGGAMADGGDKWEWTGSYVDCWAMGMPPISVIWLQIDILSMPPEKKSNSKSATCPPLLKYD